MGGLLGILKVFDIKGKKIKEETFKGQDSIECIHQRGRKTVWISAAKTLFIVNSTDISIDHTLPPKHKGRIQVIQSVGPFEVWTGGTDREVCCWSAETLQCLRTIQTDASVWSLLEDRKHQTVFVGSRSGKLLILCANGSVYQVTDSHHKDSISVLLLDHLGQVWSASWDGSVNIWRRRVKASKEPLMNEGNFTDLSFFTMNTPRTFRERSNRGSISEAPK